MLRKTLVAICLACLTPATLHATAPTSITVQGKLTDASGSPLPAGPKNFTFKIFDDSAAGNEIWPNGAGENQTLNTDAAGLWVGIAGAVVPIFDYVFLDSVRWLEITVDGTTLPRTRLLAGPYAHRVSTVDGASGGTVTSKMSIGPGHTNSGLQGFCAGADNFARGAYSSVSGGKDNIAFSDSTHVGGGGGNTAFGLRATVGGGANNETGGEQATIAGGRYNKALGLSSTVGGGYENIASGIDAHIGGGSFDSASGDASTIAGGTFNRATGNYSSIGGGANNRAGAVSTTIAGGFQNSASNDDATVGGGYNNTASGYRSTVPGGTGNIAAGAHAFACGVNAQALSDQSFVWNDDPSNILSSIAPNHFIVGSRGRIGLGTNAPEGYLHVFDGSAGSVTAANNSIAVFERDSVGYLSILTPSNRERGILFGQPGSVADGGIIYNPATPEMQFRTNENVTRLVLDEEPVAQTGSRLRIVSPTGTGSELELRHSSGTAQASLTFDQPTSPNELLTSVLGVIKMRMSTTLTSINGELHVGGNVCAINLSCPSDERLKQGIEDIENASDLLAQLRPVRYRWRDEIAAKRHWSTGAQIGLLAQDVQKVAPEAVVEMSDGYLAVDYARLVPLLIEGMKEQQKQIDELKKRIESMTP